MRSGQLDEATLRQKYIVEFKPIRAVAAEMGASVGHVYNSLRRYGIETRGTHDYPVSQKTRDHAKRIGMARKGAKVSDEQRQKISSAKKGKIRKPSKYGGKTKKKKNN